MYRTERASNNSGGGLGYTHEPHHRPRIPLSEFLQPFMGYLSAHPYLSMFVGMLVVGELVLLPAIYVAITGRIELAYVICLAIAATTIKDFALYYAGRKFPATALRRLPGQGTSRMVRGLERLFDRRGAEVLFLSKFVYGTRAAAQVLAGVHDMPLRVYLVANTLGVAALTLLLSGIAWSVAGTARRYGEVVHSVEIAFGVFLLLAATAYVSAALLARRRWSQ